MTCRPIVFPRSHLCHAYLRRRAQQRGNTYVLEVAVFGNRR
jgi:hypothetical protein